jgi:ubiquitin C-terminal hydrolase
MNIENVKIDHIDQRIVPAYGFKNTGAICYFNSLIQCILSSNHFLKFIINHDNPYNLFKEFLHFIFNEEKWDLLFTTRLLILCKMINPNQSSSEYFVYMVDLLKLEPLFECVYQDQYICHSCSNVITKKDISYCPLINDHFNEFFEHSEEIENYNCEKCKKRQTISHKKSLQELSNMVVVCLNKYFGKKMIDYPSSFILNHQKYSVIGTVEHIGTLNGGHYMCRVKRDTTIYIANDTAVHQIEEVGMNPVLETYMVFYEKVIE